MKKKFITSGPGFHCLLSSSTQYLVILQKILFVVGTKRKTEENQDYKNSVAITIFDWMCISFDISYNTQHCDRHTWAHKDLNCFEVKIQM